MTLQRLWRGGWRSLSTTQAGTRAVFLYEVGIIGERRFLFKSEGDHRLLHGTPSHENASRWRLVRQPDLRRDLTRWRDRSGRGEDDAIAAVPRRARGRGRQHR